jgi:hypothetical protein
MCLSLATQQINNSTLGTHFMEHQATHNVHNHVAVLPKIRAHWDNCSAPLVATIGPPSKPDSISAASKSPRCSIHEVLQHGAATRP